MGGFHIFHFDLKLVEQSLYDVKRLPSFYNDSVLLWEKYFDLLVQSEVNKKTVLSQAIFNNKNLLIKVSRNSQPAPELLINSAGNEAVLFKYFMQDRMLKF